ncbi:hypothetical protein RchiOBHm_Chr5g0052491 [Rosa chinensis]|uniref:Uncharacterized protein n=1 Tax=Rosa chinensis TaxID=74649 RepID=A0A2P6QFP2_ROSCH|nr:hypothetical protein RchiOBHm_Chr5g0052491 [Rosa chinensis]
MRIYSNCCGFECLSHLSILRVAPTSFLQLEEKQQRKGSFVYESEHSSRSGEVSELENPNLPV